MKQDLSSVKHVLLDIEGTICPISFVKDTLFPYALKALPDIVHDKWTDPEFEKYKAAFPNECQETTEKFIEHVKDLTERNIKIAYFKDLQGYLWEEGYKSGAYSSPFFDDVEPALRRWKENGVEMSIYSSGSVFAQKLLFGHVNANRSDDPKATVDLRPLINDWFDTANAGSKMDWKSYMKICQSLQVPSTDVLFLSDNNKELEAAQEAKLKVGLALREGNEEVNPDDKQRWETLDSFEELEVGKSKRLAEIPQNKNKRILGDSNGKANLTRNPTDAKSGADGKGFEAIEAGQDLAPLPKKQKSGYVIANVASHPPRRRSQRLQKSVGKS